MLSSSRLPFPSIHHVWLFVTGFLLLSAAVRLFATPHAVWIDEAEQVYLSQWLQAGASDAQPPLYTWIHYFAFSLTGPDLWWIIFFKFSIVILTYWFLQKIFTSKIGITPPGGILGFFSLAFILQLWDASLLSTNTLLVTFASVVSMYLIIKIVDQPRWINYIFLGLTLGIGFLSKYNFALAVVAMLLAGITISPIRRVIISPNLFLTALACVVITFPHLLWTMKNQLLVQSTLQNELGNQQNLETTASLLKGAGSFFRSLFAFTGIWLLAIILFFRKTFTRKSTVDTSVWSRFFGRYIITILALIIVSSLLFEIRIFHERYFQPFLIFIPVYVFLQIDTSTLENSSTTKWYQWLCAGVFVMIFCLNSIPFITDPLFGRPGYMHIPYDRIAGQLEKYKRQEDIIITNNILFAGNLKLNLPTNEKVLLWNDHEHFQKEINTPDQSLVYVWKDGDEFVPQMLASINKDATIDSSFIQSFEVPYHRPSGKKIKINTLKMKYSDVHQ